jgi:hypothetical protein
MKVYAAEPLIFFTFVNLNHPLLIMQHVALHKTAAAGFSTEAHHSPKILRKLSKSIRRKLVNLYMKLSQNIGQHWVWGHPKTCCKKFLKHKRRVDYWFWNDFIPQLACRAFGKVSQSLKLSDGTNGYGRGPKIIAPCRFTRILGSTFFAMVTNVVSGSITGVSSGGQVGHSSHRPRQLCPTSYSLLKS